MEDRDQAVFVLLVDKEIYLALANPVRLQVAKVDLLANQVEIRQWFKKSKLQASFTSEVARLPALERSDSGQGFDSSEVWRCFVLFQR